MSKTEREKGKRFERRSVRFLNRIFGPGTYTRDRAILETRGGATGVDLASETSVLVVQCKKRKALDVIGALQEVQRSASRSEIPIAIVERDRKKGSPATAAVVMEPELFAAIFHTAFNAMTPRGPSGTESTQEYFMRHMRICYGGMGVEEERL